MDGLVLRGDTLEMDGVPLFHATSELSPAARMRLQCEGIVGRDGLLFSQRGAGADDDMSRVSNEALLYIVSSLAAFATRNKLNATLRAAMFKAFLSPLTAEEREIVGSRCALEMGSN